MYTETLNSQDVEYVHSVLSIDSELCEVGANSKFSVQRAQLFNGPESCSFIFLLFLPILLNFQI